MAGDCRIVQVFRQRFSLMKNKRWKHVRGETLKLGKRCCLSHSCVMLNKINLVFTCGFSPLLCSVEKLNHFSSFMVENWSQFCFFLFLLFWMEIYMRSISNVNFYMIIMETFELRICSCFYNITMYCLYNISSNESSLWCDESCSECRPEVCAMKWKALIRSDKSVLLTWVWGADEQVWPVSIWGNIHAPTVFTSPELTICHTRKHQQYEKWLSLHKQTIKMNSALFCSCIYLCN